MRIHDLHEIKEILGADRDRVVLVDPGTGWVLRIQRPPDGPAGWLRVYGRQQDRSALLRQAAIAEKNPASREEFIERTAAFASQGGIAADIQNEYDFEARMIPGHLDLGDPKNGMVMLDSDAIESMAMDWALEVGREEFLRAERSHEVSSDLLYRAGVRESRAESDETVAVVDDYTTLTAREAQPVAALRLCLDAWTDSVIADLECKGIQLDLSEGDDFEDKCRVLEDIGYLPEEAGWVEGGYEVYHIGERYVLYSDLLERVGSEEKVGLFGYVCGAETVLLPDDLREFYGAVAAAIGQDPHHTRAVDPDSPDFHVGIIDLPLEIVEPIAEESDFYYTIGFIEVSAEEVGLLKERYPSGIPVLEATGPDATEPDTDLTRAIERDSR